MDCQGPVANIAEPPMCSVYSAVSGEVIAVVDKYEGKTAKEIKQIVAAQVGVPRFRLRFFPEGGCCEIADDDVFALDHVNIQLVQLEVLPPDALEDQKMIVAAMNNDSKVLEKLLQEPRSPNVAGACGLTPLHFAAASGHVEPMRLLLEAGAEKNVRSEGVPGWTPLLCSAFNSHLESVDLLLQAGADRDLATLDFGLAPLHIAAGHGHVGIVQALVEGGATLNQGTTDNGSTPFHFAAFGGRVRVVRALIKAGADLNQRTIDNGSMESMILHLEASTVHSRVVRALMAGNPNRWNQGAVLRALMKAGRHLNEAPRHNGTGTTALFVAAQKGHVQTVQALIDAGAGLNYAETKDGSRKIDVVGVLTRCQVKNLLIQAKADIDISRMWRGPGSYTATPLYAAIMNGHTQIARLLIEARADIERGDCGITPLWIAALKGHVVIVRFLIEAGANIENIRSGQPSYGTIPMLIAAHRGHVEVVQLLQQKAQQMRRALHASPSAPPWYSLRPVPPIRVATVMQPVPITAVMTFVPGATVAPPNAVESNPCGSTSSSSALETLPRRKQKSCC